MQETFHGTEGDQLGMQFGEDALAISLTFDRDERHEIHVPLAHQVAFARQLQVACTGTAKRNVWVEGWLLEAVSDELFVHPPNRERSRYVNHIDVGDIMASKATWTAIAQEIMIVRVGRGAPTLTRSLTEVILGPRS